MRDRTSSIIKVTVGCATKTETKNERVGGRPARSTYYGNVDSISCTAKRMLLAGFVSVSRDPTQST